MEMEIIGQTTQDNKIDILKESIFVLRYSEVHTIVKDGNLYYNDPNDYSINKNECDNCKKKLPHGFSLTRDSKFSNYFKRKKISKEFEDELEDWDDVLGKIDLIYSQNQPKDMKDDWLAKKKEENDLILHRYLVLSLPKTQIIRKPYDFVWNNDHLTIYHTLGSSDYELVHHNFETTLCKPSKTDYDIGIDKNYDWRPNYFLLSAASEPTWRTNKNLDAGLYAILEALLYAEEHAHTIEEEYEMKDLITKIKNCKTKQDVLLFEAVIKRCIMYKIEMYINDHFDEEENDCIEIFNSLKGIFRMF